MKVMIEKYLLISIIFALFITSCGDSSSDRQVSVDETISLAQTAIANGDYNEALRLLADAIALDPNNSKVRKARATTYAARAGISQEKLETESMLLTDTVDGLEKVSFYYSAMNLYSLANYRNETEFKFHLKDMGKAIDLMLPENGDVSSLTEEERLALGKMAIIYATYCIAYIFEGQDIDKMTDLEIAATVLFRLPMVQNSIENIYGVILQTEDSLLSQITTDYMEMTLIKSGFDSLKADIESEDFIRFFQTFNDFTR